MSDISWESAPEGATHYDTREGVYPWLKEDDNGNKYWHFNCWVNYANDIGVNDSIFAMPTKKVYTAAMCEAGTLPSVGMECMVVDSSLMNYEYEKCNILFVGVYKVVYTSESCIERFSNLDEVKFKPIDTRTDEEKSEADMIEHLTNEGIITYDPIMLKILISKFKAGKIHNVTWGK